MTVIRFFRTGTLALVSDPGLMQVRRAIACVDGRAAGCITVEVASR
jgi:hypothetical protein